MAVATAEDGCGEGMEAPDALTTAGAHACAMAVGHTDGMAGAQRRQQRAAARGAASGSSEGGREEWHERRIQNLL